MERTERDGQAKLAGETFERLIKRSAGTFTAAAEELHLHEATLRRYARGATTPSKKTVHVIERWLCTTLGDVYAPGTMAELWYPGWNAPAAPQAPESPSTRRSDAVRADSDEDPSAEERDLAAGTKPKRKARIRAAMVAVLVAAALTGGTVAIVRANREQGTTAQLGVTKTIQIYNKVTTGKEMREDSVAFLSSKPVNFCRRDGCVVEGTDVLTTGAKVTAVCQTLGARNTNGEDNNPADDENPELFESRLWYGVRWPDGRFGFFSEVWIYPSDRGGLGLPLC